MAREAVHPNGSTPKRILLVEDDPDVAISLRLLLTLAGRETEMVPHGEAALAKFDPARHDIVITDLRLPGMNGLELAEAIRRRQPQQPIILTSGSPEAVAASVQSNSISVLLGKPFDLRQLQEALTASLRSTELGQLRTISV